VDEAEPIILLPIAALHAVYDILSSIPK